MRAKWCCRCDKRISEEEALQYYSVSWLAGTGEVYCEPCRKRIASRRKEPEYYPSYEKEQEEQ